VVSISARAWGTLEEASIAAVRRSDAKALQRFVGTGVLALMPLEAALMAARGRGGRTVALTAGWLLARKKLGLRYVLDVVPLDPSHVKGSHGRLPDDPRDGLVFLCSEPDLGRDRVPATGVRDLLLELSGVPAATSAGLEGA